MDRIIFYALHVANPSDAERLSLSFLPRPNLPPSVTVVIRQLKLLTHGWLMNSRKQGPPTRIAQDDLLNYSMK